MEPAHVAEGAAERGGDPGRLAHDVSKGRDEGAVLSHRPQAQIAEASALDESGVQQLFERALDRMGVRRYPARDLARVQLLPRQAHEQAQDLARDPATSDDTLEHLRTLPRSLSNRPQS